MQRDDGSVVPRNSHAERWAVEHGSKQRRCQVPKSWWDCTSMDGLTKLIEEVVRKTLEDIIHKVVQTAWTLTRSHRSVTRRVHSHWINEYNSCVTRLSLRTDDQGDAAHEPSVKMRREPCTCETRLSKRHRVVKTSDQRKRKSSGRPSPRRRQRTRPKGVD